MPLIGYPRLDRGSDPLPPAESLKAAGGDSGLRIECWVVDGLDLAWSGGASEGSHTASGPSATNAILRFFLTPDPTV